MLTLYGIPNCDTVKKARTWLDNHGQPYIFHDYKKQGISADKLNSWLDEFPLEKVMNKASATWKALSDEEKSAIVDRPSAIALMTEKTSVIKRPLIEDASGKAVAVGFSDKDYSEKFL